MKHLLVLTGMLAAACTAPASTSVSGRVDQSTFAQVIDQVTVVKAGRVVATAPVAATGEFAISIPAGTGYRMELGSKATLISPRSTGKLDVTFNVHGGGSFALGSVHAIGAVNGHTFAYGHHANDGECENGVDSTGAVCVDDNQMGGSCDQQDTGGTGDTADETTDSGGSGDTTDGTTDQSGSGDSADEGAPEEGAVADTNMPQDVGCDSGDNSDSNQNDGESSGD